jgi:PAS domain S-box-containing protein
MTPPRVLLIDDDRDTLEMYSLLLSMAGHDSVTAGSVDEGIRLALESRPSVVVSDWRLPDGDGLDLFAGLQRRGSTRRIPRIAVTGMTLEAPVVAAARRLGCKEILTKPTTPEALMAAIRRGLEVVHARHLRAVGTRVRRAARRAQGALNSAPTEAARLRVLAAELLTQRAARENDGVALMLADDEGRYLAANDGAAALTGYPPNEISGLSIWDLTPVPNGQEGRALWMQFIHEGMQEGRYTMQHRSGRPVEAHYVAIANIAPGLHLSALSAATALPWAS